jgi:AcrR family transcriptional regulator
MPAQVRTRRTLRKAREDAYRGLIVEAATHVFAERGYAEAKVQEIAEAAGVAIGTVYAIFPSKQELYRAVHRENLDELARRYAEIPTAGPVQPILLERIAVSTRFLTERPDYLRMYLREAGHWGFDPTELPEGAAAFVDADLYRRGVASGELVDEDPAVVQSLAMTAGQVHLFHWLERSLATGRPDSPDALIARIQAHCRRALFARSTP